MNKTTMYAIIVGLVAFILGQTTVHYYMARKHQPHTCGYDDCPYKGVCRAGADSSVAHYTGQRYTDGWCIDMLHIEYPDLTNDQLDSILFNKRGNRYGY